MTTPNNYFPRVSTQFAPANLVSPRGDTYISTLELLPGGVQTTFDQPFRAFMIVNNATTYDQIGIFPLYTPEGGAGKYDSPFIDVRESASPAAIAFPANNLIVNLAGYGVEAIPAISPTNTIAKVILFW